MSSSGGDAFFAPRGGGRYLATGRTAGPWDPAAQHGGPLSALLAREAEAVSALPEAMTARVTVEILGAVPVGEVLTLSAAALRPGRRVELLGARASVGGREVAQVRVWRVARTSGVTAAPRDPAPPGPTGEVMDVTGTPWESGYLGAVEWDFLVGSFLERGPSTVWTRLRVPLVDGEETSPLSRVLAVADSGNGVSGELDLASWYYINPELTVHLSREAVGERVCLDATTTVADGGVGLATSTLSDVSGPLARGAQSLLVAPR